MKSKYLPIIIFVFTIILMFLCYIGIPFKAATVYNTKTYRQPDTDNMKINNKKFGIKSKKLNEDSFDINIDDTFSTPLALTSPVVELTNAGSRGILRAKDGTLLLDARLDGVGSIYSAKTSPNEEFLILDRADGINDLYRLHSFSFIRRLPMTAPVERGSSIDRWTWLDSEHLVAISGVEKKSSSLEGMTALEKESEWCERRLIYIYDINSDTLEELKIHQLQLSPLYEVTQILEGGHLQIGGDFSGNGWNSFWFKIIKK